MDMTLEEFVKYYELDKHRMESLIKSYDAMTLQFEKYRRKNTPNNKLKRNGEPMRRRA